MGLAALPRAKLNLTLDVGPREADGYHNLRSVFLRLGLADRLTCRPAPQAGRDRLSVAGPQECPVEDNLVLDAVARLRLRIGQPMPWLAVGLAKHIPIGAGLGGGSSDAAAMVGLAEVAWGIRLSPPERLALSLALGSDVPFFAADVPAAVVEGRGEAVRPLPAVRGGAGVLLAISPLVMATGPVYRRHDELTADGAATPARPVTDELAEALFDGIDGRRLCEWSERLRGANDLWPAARSLAPELDRLRDALERAIGRPWMLTGSGSGLFALFATGAEAVEAGRSLGDGLLAGFPETRLLADDLHAADPTWRYPP